MQSVIKLLLAVAVAAMVAQDTLVEGTVTPTTTPQTLVVGNDSTTLTPDTTDASTSTPQTPVVGNHTTTLTPKTLVVGTDGSTSSPQNVTEEPTGLPVFEGAVLREAGEDVEDEDMAWLVLGCRYYCIWKEGPYCCDDGSISLPPDHDTHEGLACPPMHDQICKNDAIYLATYSIKTARYSGSLPLVKGAPKTQLMCASDGYCLQDEKCCPSHCAGRHICLPGLLPIEELPLDSDDEETEGGVMEKETEGGVMEEEAEGRVMEEEAEGRVMEEEAEGRVMEEEAEGRVMEEEAEGRVMEEEAEGRVMEEEAEGRVMEEEAEGRVMEEEAEGGMMNEEDDVMPEGDEMKEVMKEDEP